MSAYIKDQKYTDRLDQALFQAVFEASIDPKTNTSVILAGESIDSAIKLAAMLAATTSVTSTPAKATEFTEMIAKRMQKMIAETRDLQAKGRLNFMNVSERRENH